MDVHIESASSEFNEHLHVVLSKGRYQLLTNNAIYSYGDLYSNYRRAFERIQLSQRRVNNVLILGLGLGSIPYMLETRFQQKYHYTTVEIDETVAWLAHKYVTQYLKSPIEVICADAFAYVVQQAEERIYDMICVDVFVDDQIPSAIESKAFWNALKLMLGDTGILLFNRLYKTKTDRRLTKDFYESVFLNIFPDGDFMDVGGNWMITNKDLLQK